jgi:hypothetical protein
MLGFVFAWTLLAIEPIDRGDWALENALVVVVVLALIASHRVSRCRAFPTP